MVYAVTQPGTDAGFPPGKPRTNTAGCRVRRTRSTRTDRSATSRPTGGTRTGRDPGRSLQGARRRVRPRRGLHGQAIIPSCRPPACPTAPGTRQVHQDRGADPLSHAASAHHPLRDVRYQVPPPGAHGLLAAGGSATGRLRSTSTAPATRWRSTRRRLRHPMRGGFRPRATARAAAALSTPRKARISRKRNVNSRRPPGPVTKNASRPASPGNRPARTCPCPPTRKPTGR